MPAGMSSTFVYSTEDYIFKEKLLLKFWLLILLHREFFQQTGASSDTYFFCVRFIITSTYSPLYVHLLIIINLMLQEKLGSKSVAYTAISLRWSANYNYWYAFIRVIYNAGPYSYRYPLLEHELTNLITTLC